MPPVKPPDPINPWQDMPTDDPPVKPGWQTTEFWLALVAQVMPVLVLLNVIKTGDVASLQGALNSGIQAVFALIVSGGVIGKYIQSRAHVKTGIKP